MPTSHDRTGTIVTGPWPQTPGDAEAPPPPLKGGGGGDMFDGMEQRIARLERTVDRVDSSLADVRERLSRIEGEISRLPGYPGIAVIVGLIVALSTAAQIGARFLN